MTSAGQRFQVNLFGEGEVVRAMCIMLVAMLIAPFMDAIAKALATNFNVSPATVTLGRFIVQSVFLLPFIAILWTKKLAPFKVSLGNCLRGMIMGIAAMLFFTALKYMPIADAIAIFFVEPLIVMLLSSIFLGEEVGWRRRIAALVGFLGALIVIRPSYELFGLISLLPLCTAFLFSVYIILTRKLGGEDDPLVMQFWAGIGGVFSCSLAIVAGTLAGSENFGLSLPQVPQGWALLVGIGMFAVVSHMLIVIAFSMAPASVLAPFQYVEIVSATILGLLLFGDFPDLVKWIGISIIIGSGVYIFVREQRLEREAREAVEEELLTKR